MIKSGFFDPLAAGCDGALRTYQYAEMAADAFFAVQDRSAVFRHADGLVASVGAGNGTSAAADAFVPLEFVEYHLFCGDVFVCHADQSCFFGSGRC